MARLVSRPLAPPSPELVDFTVSVQQNLEDLFGSSHDHNARTTAPGPSDGKVGDSMGVFDGTTYKFYYKFPSGWKSVTMS